MSLHKVIARLGAINLADPTNTTINLAQINTMLNNLANAPQTSQSPPGNPSPASRKLGSPDKFSGNQKEDVDAWINHMNMYCDLSGMSTQEKLGYAPFFLHGHAMKWYQTLSIKPQTWDDLCNHLLAQFQPVNPVSTTRCRRIGGYG